MDACLYRRQKTNAKKWQHQVLVRNNGSIWYSSFSYANLLYSIQNRLFLFVREVNYIRFDRTKADILLFSSQAHFMCLNWIVSNQVENVLAFTVSCLQMKKFFVSISIQAERCVSSLSFEINSSRQIKSWNHIIVVASTEDAFQA